MTKIEPQSPQVESSPLVSQRVTHLVQKYPLRILGVCWLLTVASSSSLQSYIKQTGTQMIWSLDESLRRFAHPGYSGDGQYNSPGVYYYNEVKKGTILSKE
jgi:hypothetical protein